MIVSTVIPLPGKGLTEAMDSTAGRYSHALMDGSAKQAPLKAYSALVHHHNNLFTVPVD
jgi:hypothetical protein